MYLFENAIPESTAILKPMFEKALQGEKIETIFQSKGIDQRVFYQLTVNPVFGKNREVLFCTVFGMDITELKKGAEQINEQKNLLQSIIESTTSSVFSFDTELRYIAFNENHKRTMKKIYGIDIHIGMNAKTDLKHLPDYELNMGFLQRALNGEQFINIEKYGLKEFHQSIHEITFSPIKDEFNIVKGISIFSQNITEKIKAEVDLRLAEKKFREIFENSPDAIFLEDSSGTILDLNEAASAIQGCQKTDLIGMNIRQLVPENEFRKILTDYKKLYYGSIKSVEGIVWSRDKGLIPVEIKGKKILFEDKPAILLHVRDISERKNLETEHLRLEQEKAKQKEKLFNISLEIQERERNRIAMEIHDDIGAGLSKISMLCQVMKKTNADAKTNSINLDKIILSSKEAHDSINEIIWSINPMNDKLDSLVAFINHYASEYLETTTMTFHFIGPNKSEDVNVNGSIRRNIFLMVKEALNNIVKYTQNCSVMIEISFENNILAIIITDTGPGFDIKQVKQFSNGIKNMKNRVKEIAGTFFINSVPGQGTSIEIKIPLQNR